MNLFWLTKHVLSPARVTLEYGRRNAALRYGALRYVAVRYVALRLVIEKAFLVLLLTVRLLLTAFCPQIDFSSKHNALSMMLTNVKRDFFLGRLIKSHYGFYYQLSHRNRKAFKLTSISP